MNSERKTRFYSHHFGLSLHPKKSKSKIVKKIEILMQKKYLKLKHKSGDAISNNCKERSHKNLSSSEQKFFIVSMRFQLLFQLSDNV